MLLSAPVVAEVGLDEALGGFDEPPVAAGSADIDSLLDGFDSSPMTVATTLAVTASKSWSLSGHMALEAVYVPDGRQVGTVDYGGLSSLQGSALLELEGELVAGWKGFASGYAGYDAAYAINGRSDYPAAVLEELESELELRELFLQGRLASSVDITLGRQIVSWGKSDNLRVVDVINPLDQREPGMVDIEDIRLPLTMSRIDYYRGDWHLQTLLIHEQRFDKRAVAGGEFLPNAPMQTAVVPAQTLANTELAVALNGRFSGWDLSLYGANLFNDQTHLESGRMQHARISMAGAALNVALGNWLYKGELAYFDGLEFAAQEGTGGRIELLQGVEYTGIAETQISLEMVQRHLTDYNPAMASAPDNVAQDEVQWALRLTRDFINDQLQLTALMTRLDWDGSDGGFQRLSLDYELDAHWSWRAGLVSYVNGNKPLYNGIEVSDRIFVESRYSF